MADAWYDALCILADHEPFAYWHLTYGAAFWWTPDRTELGPEGFTKQPFSYAEIASIRVFSKVQIGTNIVACDWPSLRDKLLGVRGLTIEELQDVQCGPARPPNHVLHLEKGQKGVRAEKDRAEKEKRTGQKRKAEKEGAEKVGAEKVAEKVSGPNGTDVSVSNWAVKA